MKQTYGARLQAEKRIRRNIEVYNLIKMNKQRGIAKQNINRRPGYYRSQNHLFSLFKQTKEARLQTDKQNRRYLVLQ